MLRPLKAAGARDAPDAVDRRPKPRRRSSFARREAVEGYLFISPWIVGLVVFTVGPIVVSLYLSFTQYSVFTAPTWIGVTNYTNILTRDRLFWTSLYDTAYFVVVSVPVNVIIALLMGLLLSVNLPGIGLYRTFYYVPVVVPSVANALLWSILFSNEGLVNEILQFLHLPRLNWLFDPRITKLIFVVMDAWGVGTTAMIFLSGLKNIPATFYESANVDGAGLLQRFWHVTIPLLTPVIFFNVVIGIINTFQVFTGAYVITSGGPANATLFYVLYLYQNGFSYFKMGYASALAWILFLIIFVFTVIQLRLARRWVYYEAQR
jgi:multiple sugar transport system permease protein